AAKSPRWSVARRAFPFSLGTRASRTKTPRAGHGAQIRVPRRHSCARRRSPPPRGVENERCVSAMCRGRKEKEEDEVEDRETNRTKIVGWVERRPRRGRAERAWRRETQQCPRAGRATLGLARALDLTYGELFAGLFDIVNLKTALRRSPHERQRHAGLLRRGESRRRLFRRV